jgi:PKD repeat protein
MSVIEFYDESLNEPETWTWEITPTGSFFVNGTNTHSQDPVVFFNTSGSYQVKLTVSNSDGSNSITKSNFIRISDAPAIPIATDTMFCDEGSALLQASGSTGNYLWWNSIDKTLLLSDSASYQTPILNGTTSYYVEALPDLVSSEQSTVYNNTNYANGNMFDVTALHELRIDSISLNIHDYLEHTVEVYFKQGSFEGSEQKPDDWALIGTYQVFGKGSNTPASVDIDDTHLSAGETYGFYVTLVSGSLGYTHGGNVFTGEDIIIDCGAGVVYPFSTSYEPRTWNGTLHYSIGEYSCNSGLKEVQVIVIPTPDTPENQFQDVCYDNDSILLSDNGNILTWYADSLLTDTLATGATYQPDNLEVGLNKYYLTDRKNTCISSPGKITVALHAPVDLPVTDNYNICYGDTALLVALGDSIRWYQNEIFIAATDTLPISGDTDGTQHYQVTNTVDGCESKTLPVELLVQPKTPEPKSTNKIVCENDTVILSAEGSHINWYDYSDMSLVLENEDTLVLKSIKPGEHKLIVTNQMNGCESDTIIVAVQAKALPALPRLIKNSFCEGDFVSLVTEGDNIRWFTDELMTELVSDSSVYDAGYLEANTYEYFLDRTIDGCVSELNPQQVVVNPLPDVDLGADTTIYLNQEMVISCDIQGDYLWQDNSTGNSFDFVADEFGVGIHKVSVFITNEANCAGSGQIMVEVKDPLGQDPNKEEDFILVYPNPTSGMITIEFNRSIELPLLLNLYDATGRCALKKEIEYIETGDRIELDLTSEAKGIYMLIIGNEEIESNYRIIYK